MTLASIAAAAASSGERMWQMPIFPEYKELIETIQDLRDIPLRGPGQGRATRLDAVGRTVAEAGAAGARRAARSPPPDRG